MPHPSGEEQATREPWRPSWVAAVVLVVLGIAALTPPVGSADPTSGGDVPSSLLTQGWRWLAANKDSLTALSALLTAISVFVAVLTFWKVQRLNQAKAIYDAMKEARDLKLKVNPLKEDKDRPTHPVLVGVMLFASLDQYRLSGLIDARSWRIFEADLEHLVRRPDIGLWLEDAVGAPNFLPPTRDFDPRFIAHLRAVRACVQGAARY